MFSGTSTPLIEFPGLSNAFCAPTPLRPTTATTGPKSTAELIAQFEAQDAKHVVRWKALAKARTLHIENVEDTAPPGIPACSWERLKNYQKEAFLRCRASQFRYLLAMDTGTGKTPVAAVVLAHLLLSDKGSPAEAGGLKTPKGGMHALFACPASIQKQQREQLHAWMTGNLDGDAKQATLEVCDVVLWTGKEWPLVETTLRPTVVVASYERIARGVDRVPPLAALVIDECHRLRGQETKSTRALHRICRATPHRILMSGTPLPNHVRDLWPQLHAIAPFMFPEFGSFGRRYCSPQRQIRRLPGGRPPMTVVVYNGQSNAEELHSILRHYMYRRRKVVEELPAKTRRLLVVDPEKGCQLSTIDTPEEGKPEEGKPVMAKADEEPPHILEELAKAARVRAKGLDSVVETVLQQHPDEKILFFCHHKTLFRWLQTHLAERGITSIAIDGETTMARRHRLLQQLRAQEDVRAAVLAISACNYGLNLQCATVVVFTELRWSPDELLQAEDRAHRMGQTRPVSIYYTLLSGNALEARMWWRLKEKMRTAAMAIDGTRKTGFAFSKQ